MIRLVARARLAQLSSPAPARLRVLLTAAIVMVAAFAALALSLSNLHRIAPSSLWWEALSHADAGDLRNVVIRDAWAPRVVVAWLAGATLGMAGAIFQQVLRNPIAEPMTIGVSAGAQLAMTLATIYAPVWIAGSPLWIALTGASTGGAVVFALAWRSGLSPVVVAVSGMVVSLYCGSASAALQMLHAPYMHALFIWGAGSLGQQGWSGVTTLGFALVAAIGLSSILLRPMVLVGLDDASVHGLGLSVPHTRFAALALAVALGGMVTGVVGVIGFVGLAAPAIARLVGARRLGPRLASSAVCGALMLWLTDAIVQRASGAFGDLIPAGAATALIGTPVMLMLMTRVPDQAGAGTRTGSPQIGLGRAGVRWFVGWPIVCKMAAGAAICVGIVACALMLGRDGHGWHWATPCEFARLAIWRVPRMVAAVAAGGMLAVAGVMMQRLTGNALASPELLGVSGGASLGLVSVMVCMGTTSALVQALAASVGAVVTLVLVFGFALRARFAPERLVLAGISIAASSQAVTAIVIAGGGERAVRILTWLAGSTYSITRHEAALVAALSMAFCSAAPLLQRWLAILPLGESHARALGMPVTQARLVVLLLVAATTGAATLIVGPLSFVGLTAPHFARLAGARRPIAQMMVAVVAGACVMLLADWLGREWLMPRELPAGLMATLIGTPYLMWLLWRHR